MKLSITLFIILTILLGSINTRRVKPLATPTPDLDMLLIADSLNFLQKGVNNNLTLEMAEVALQEYFSKKKSFRRRELRMCAATDTIYKMHLNNDRYIDAVLRYDIYPCVGNGQYFPHTALLTHIKGKYRMISQDIIPNNFFVDTVYQNGKQTIIKGSHDDIINQVRLRKFTARLNQ